MQQAHQINKLFKDLYNGSPWIDVNIVQTLQSVTAAHAANKPLPGSNSIWQIIYHLVQWRKNILERLNGHIIPSPDHNYFIEIIDHSEVAWKELLNDLESTQKEWINFIGSLTEENLYLKKEEDSYTTYEFIMGIIQHDAYHLGQVAMIRKWVK